MRKLWLIARREYLYNFKRRSFLFTAFGVPLFSFVMMFIVIGLAENTSTATGQLGHIGYVDEAGILANPVDQPAEYVAFPNADAAQAALVDRQIGAYFVVRPDFMTAAGEVDAYAYDGISDGIVSQFEDFIKATLGQRVTSDVPLDRILNPLHGMTVVDLSSGGELTGTDAFMGRFLVPFAFAFVFLMAVNTTSQFLMSSVVEEKENRMMEILITSSTPLEMLWGKVLGLGVLGLTQVVLWALAGVMFVSAQPDTAANFLSGLRLTPDLLVAGLCYLVLGYFLFGAIMAGVGATATAEQEGRQFSGIFSLVAVIPMMLLVTFLQDPNGTIPVILSLFPLTAPVSMLMRMPMTAVPAWQIIVSLGVLALTVFATVWIAARVFRLGLLMYGKRLTVREIVQALRQGRQTMTSVAQVGEGGSGE